MLGNITSVSQHFLKIVAGRYTRTGYPPAEVCFISKTVTKVYEIVKSGLKCEQKVLLSRS